MSAVPETFLHDWGGQTAEFHWFWLRQQCPCCVHPTTRERIVELSDFPLQIRPAAVVLTDDTVAIDWGGHESHFPRQWLHDHAYHRGPAHAHAPDNDVRRLTLEVDATDVTATAGQALGRVRRDGAVRVPGMSADTEAIIAGFERWGLQVIATHFGRIEDLRTDNTTNSNTDQLGYTDAAIDVHTDQPFLDHPPRYQLLHGMRVADEGGASVVVDVAQVTRHLREHDAEAFHRITTTPVLFHRKQRAFERKVLAPILQVNAAGELVQVRYSYFTLAPLALPFEEMLPYARALRTFATLVRDPAHQVRFLLEPGDALLYDNHRMLHARTAFSGPRWVRGVYFDEA